MPNLNKIMLWFFLCLFFMGLSLRWVQAQQTIYNVPSADITPKGSFFLQHESQFRPWPKGQFLGTTHYTALGIGKQTELDLTLFNLNAPLSGNLTLGPGFKSGIRIMPSRFPEAKPQLTVGSMLPVSLQQRNVGLWSYGHISLRVPRLNTRLTCGLNYGSKLIFGRQSFAVITGLEQPLGKRVSLLADWYSGTHSLGLLITGVSVALPRDTTAYLGVQIPNNAQCGRSGLVFELSKLVPVVH
jgi:hypothetical protein